MRLAASRLNYRLHGDHRGRRQVAVDRIANDCAVQGNRSPLKTMRTAAWASAALPRAVAFDARHAVCSARHRAARRRVKSCRLLMRTSLVLALVTTALAARGADVLVAVAANFAGPTRGIAEAFHAVSGHTLKVSAGATGKFYSQILAGAPFEVLLAADQQTPRRLVATGHAVAGSQFTYAVGRLVLWSARPGLVDDQGAVLAAGAFDKLALANPKLAPYGVAALQVLRARGLADALAPKLVTAESIAQAYQFVATGNAELGFVALSQVQLPGRPAIGSMWRVPQALYEPIRQDAVLLAAGRSNPAAAALLEYLKGAEAQRLIAAYGYGGASEAAR
jgi:molybdate transport system substrate-binding protein